MCWSNGGASFIRWRPHRNQCVCFRPPGARRIEIDQSLLAANDKAMIEDLIVVAVNDGLRRVQEMVAEEMRKLSPMGGIDLSHLFGGSQ